MSDSQLVEQAWVVYCIETQEFLCGTPNNRIYGDFGNARIFRKQSAAINSKKMQPTLKKAVVLPISVSIDRKSLFKAVLKGGE